jgi:hypothetical protein
MSPKATLIYYFKEAVQRRYVLEQTIHAVPLDNRYPDGVKYSLTFSDTRTGDRVLMDNHQPKGPHVHLGEEEIPYEYINDKTLLGDFKKFVLQHMGVKL